MKSEVLIARLREHAEWAEANIWEVPISLPSELREAADLLENLTSPTGIDELGLSTRAYESLCRRGYRLAREIKGFSVDDLVKIPGIGRGTAQEITEKVEAALK